MISVLFGQEMEGVFVLENIPLIMSIQLPMRIRGLPIYFNWVNGYSKKCKVIHLYVFS